jgi:hypothetical protein
MRRRDFIRLSVSASAAALGAPRLFAQAGPAASVRLTLRPDQLGNKIGNDFTGLSYESAQLGDPNFFSGKNVDLMQFLRRLGNTGVLRIGGNTSDYCNWTPDASATPVSSVPSAPVGPDTGLKKPPITNITQAAIRNLREFLDASGWKLIYGLNLGTGNPETAAAEAAYVNDTIGSSLMAFQLGNEPDLFSRNGLRATGYNFNEFAQEWQRFFDAIRARVPFAPFAGPDTAYNNEWLVPFAKQFKNQAQVISQHYYAEGPPTDPSMTIDRLLRPNPKLHNELQGMEETMQESGRPFRLAETNSCYSGGKQGVSDTFASALWGADLMYQLAAAGGKGINFHGGGYGWYTPIAGTMQNGFVARPLYYGMLMFAQTGAGTLIGSTLDGAEAGSLLTAYALLANDGGTRVAVFNKNADRDVSLSIEGAPRTQQAIVFRLRAPRLDDTTDVTFAGAPVGASGQWTSAKAEVIQMQNGIFSMDLPAASAALVSFANS